MHRCIQRNEDPFLPAVGNLDWRESGNWPAKWIACPGLEKPPFVCIYRVSFSLKKDEKIVIHVTADERYDLFLDGERVGRGPQRGSPDWWFYETYELSLGAGEHRLTARVYSQGEWAAAAQMSAHAGFLLAAEGGWSDLLNTGIAGWEAKPLAGYDFIRPSTMTMRAARVRVNGAVIPWGYQNGDGEGWLPVLVLKPGIARISDWEYYQQHRLKPAMLPEMFSARVSGALVRFIGLSEGLDLEKTLINLASSMKEEGWQTLIDGSTAMTIAPNTSRRVIIDLNNYYCAFPELTFSGGAGSRVRLSWAEALFQTTDPWQALKGNRNELDGRYFIGIGDEFLPDGGEKRHFEVLWWNAGRYLELVVETGSEALRIDQLTLTESRYPLEMESSFSASDRRLSDILPVLVRGMQMCSNETFFDCPYYEELMYAGDTRLECLTTYVMARDDRLPRKALRLFDVSRSANGLTQSRFPSRMTQFIPPFALWWVAMVSDYAFWRGTDLVHELMPGVRATIGAFERWMGDDGLLHAPEGWNFMDWVPAWKGGIPPEGNLGVSGLINWQYIYVLKLYAALEEALEPGSVLAVRARWMAAELASNSAAAFWDEKRGMLADDLAHRFYSEHTQCMAILSEEFPLGNEAYEQMIDGLLNAPDLSRTTIYFTHYLFETFAKINRVDQFLERMNLWYGVAQNGFKTPVESPEPSRSDCHAWGSHPMYHYFATILGIRPAEVGFTRVIIQPQLGTLHEAAGVLVHPAGGVIEERITLTGGVMHGVIVLPEGIEGRLVVGGRTRQLASGKTEFEFDLELENWLI